MALLKNKYMPLSDADVSPERVATYDGQHITLSSAPGTTAFAMGNYLGGGIAGVVYEAFDQRMKRPVAVKILNPVGYKLTSPGALRRAEIIKKGVPIVGNVRGMTLDNVYWVHLPRRKELLACYVTGCGLAPPVLRELTLEMCVSLWLLDHHDEELRDQPQTQRRRRMRSSDRLTTSMSCEDPVHEPSRRSVATASAASAASAADMQLDQVNEETEIREDGEDVIVINDVTYVIPSLPAKYRAFLQARKTIYREIAHMHKLTGNSVSGERIGSGHENVLQLYDVLELVQPSKSTIFLVLELAYGGELFERIRGDSGVEEEVARTYFMQLLAGVRYCHQLGIVHRDLKPENLLLSDSDVLKIADFGLSAHFIAAVSSGASADEDNNDDSGLTNLMAPSGLRRLNSIVGSPHYVAPEVLQNARYGYDGRKADMWSSGVILYGLLVGTLPFGRDLATCPRYLKFSEWLRSLPCDSHTGKLTFDSQLFQAAGNLSTSKQQLLELSTHPNFPPASAMRGLILNGSQKLWNQNQAIGSCSPSASCNGPILADAKAFKSVAVGASTVQSRRSVAFPTWLFPSTLSPSAAFLLASLLHSDPNKRISCEEACKSSWVLGV
ncbi:camk camkl protein kinase [Plasmopara halstedii]|uniref:non-specific serine/threonine protein kinase n=1 Tax=Plasmopara halstedii TaxID=4781 RepID=A0A0P1AXE0_PLAHL|nr:camk camkl protein kinase [Plasmopara halstedii]CEG47120.1 camk camkl protein kinase [Plasmopara halstedii]|eukprot:XP_024583489.1 camk camkl protein kinase [Plasmopara halstedii]